MGLKLRLFLYALESEGAGPIASQRPTLRWAGSGATQ